MYYLIGHTYTHMHKTHTAIKNNFKKICRITIQVGIKQCQDLAKHLRSPCPIISHSISSGTNHYTDFLVTIILSVFFIVLPSTYTSQTMYLVSHVFELYINGVIYITCSSMSGLFPSTICLWDSSIIKNAFLINKHITYYMLVTLLSMSQILTHLTLTTLSGRHYYSPQCTDEKTEVHWA